MKLSESVKPITYFKAHAAEVLDALDQDGNTMVITQNGEAKAVVMGIREYERFKDAIALMQLLAQSERSIRAGRGKTMDEGFEELWKKIDHEDREE
ncbi:MAG: type II toxin-antitoxin system Phd/YefM family antitoxin [Trichloromonadaceae bacterium]